MVDNSSNLNEILKITSKMAAQNMRIMAVFDLDSTLFNVSTRTKKILLEFAEVHSKDDLKLIEVFHTDWGVKEALVRGGYHFDKNLELHNQLKDFWLERFFSDDYLQYDVPYPGAIEFVLELQLAGAEIFYLTGRDVQRMGRGSKQVLLKWGFPCSDSQLILKPHKSMNDELFKLEYFIQLDRTQFQKVYFFENEPVNINAVLKSCPDVEIIFLDTTHARKQTVTAPIQRIPNFKRS